MKQYSLFALILIHLFLMFSCKSSKQVYEASEKQFSEIILRDTVKIEKHRVDSFYRRDSIYVTQIQKKDTVYITKTVYRYQARSRETKTAKDSIKLEEKKAVEEIKVEKKKEVKKNNSIIGSLVLIGILILFAKIVLQKIRS